MAKKQKKKVFFWLKLDQNFFKNLAIKQALRMPGGKDMIIVYQMLMLESLATDGVIYYEGTLPTIEKELAVRLDVKEEDVQMTLAYFKSVGLVQIDDSNNAEMLQIPALIEQETDWARYKREQRKILKLDNVQHVSNSCPTELELELELELEKDIDIDSRASDNEKIPYKDIITLLNEKTGRKYKHNTPKTMALIKARWNEGYRLEDFERAIAIKSDEWSGTEWDKYLRPDTLFGPKFENYVNQKPVKKNNVPEWVNPEYKEEPMTKEEKAELQRIQDDIVRQLEEMEKGPIRGGKE